MAATVFPAPSSESLPILASQKVFETFSADGFMSYRPTGGLPAGRYAVEARGVDVDYLDITAPGFSYQGKGNMAFFQVPAGGGEIQATACTYGDPGFLATARTFAMPTFIFEAEVEGTYSWNPGNQIAYDPTSGNYVAFGSNSSNLRLYCSTNGTSWTGFGSGLANGAWTHLGDTVARGIIGDVAYMKGALYATSFHPDGGGMYRTFDLTGRSGWSMVFASNTGGFNLFASPNSSSNRVFRTEQGLVRYSDNNGSSWTQVVIGTGIDTGNGIYSPVTKGNDIYVISSGRYYSSSQTSKIYRSTDDGSSWTQLHDFGSTWIPVSMAYSPTLDRFAVIVIDSSNPRLVRIWFSDNNCSTFTVGASLTSELTSAFNHSIIWHNDRFVLAQSPSNGSGPTQLATSTNGTATSAVRTYSGRITSLISTPLGVLYRHTSGTHGLFRTSDFATFFEPTSSFSNPNGLAYANGNYMITNGSTSYLWGPTLDNLELKTNAPVPISQVVAGNGVFLARNPNTSGFATTADSVTWTNGLGGAGSTHVNIPSFAGGFFFRQDSNRDLWTSIDGTTWTLRARVGHVMDRYSKVKDIFIGYGRLQTGGTTTLNYISRDLTTWEPTTSGTNGNYWSIAYSETEKVYIGQLNNNTNLVACPSINFNDTQNTNFTTGLFAGRNQTSLSISTSNVGRVENIAGLAIARTGYILRDGSGTTTDLPAFRLYSGLPSANTSIIIPDTTNNEQISRANGEMSLIAGPTATMRVKYGKPAAFAVYRLKD